MINYSFIIPHHNGPELLNRLLNSIPQREDIEIIVVDDNSDEDKKPQVSRSDVQLIFVPKEESKGAGHARNVGLGKAKGKWLLFADSDDFYAEGFINTLDYYVNSHLDVVFFDAYLNYEFNTQIVPTEKGYLHSAIVRYEESSKTEYDKNHLLLSSNQPWNKMIDRNFAISIGVLFEEIPMSNDAWFINNISVCAKSIAVVDKKLYYYVKNPVGITHSSRPFSHYMASLKSNIRRNKLKYQNGCWDLIDIPGFNVSNVKRDLGYVIYFYFIFYKLFMDYTFIHVIVKKVTKK